MAANGQDTVSSLLNEAIRLLSNDTNDTNQAQLNRESSSHSQRVAENFRQDHSIFYFNNTELS